MIMDFLSIYLFFQEILMLKNVMLLISHCIITIAIFILQKIVLLLFQLDLKVIAGSPSNYATVCSQMNIDVVAEDANDVSSIQDMHFIIAADVISNQSYNVLKNLAAALKPNGFVLLEETATQLNLKIALKQTNLILIAKQIDPIGKTYLLLKKLEKNKEPIIIQIVEKNFSWLEGLKAALKKADSESQQVLLVSQGEPLLGKMF